MTMKEQSKTLTHVQMKFIDQYLEDPSDGGAAYMRASGSQNKKSCTVQASKLLKMEKVQDALKQRAEDILGPVHARILKNVEFWLDMRDDPEASGMIRMKASENLGKYMQMFVEKKEISGGITVTIVDDI